MPVGKLLARSGGDAELRCGSAELNTLKRSYVLLSSVTGAAILPSFNHTPWTVSPDSQRRLTTPRSELSSVIQAMTLLCSLFLLMTPWLTGSQPYLMT